MTAFVKDDRVGKVFLDSTSSGGARCGAAYSPRIRPHVRLHFLGPGRTWSGVTPADFTVRTAVALLGDADPWSERMPEPQRLTADLIAEGHTIPVARVQAMHEGKRRARAARDS